MTKKRFSRLKYALTTLRTPNSTGETPDAPAGTVAKNFQDFAGGKTKLTYPRAEGSKPGEILTVSVLPFYYAGATGRETLVAQSKRADDQATMDGVQTACNQIAADLETHSRLADFIPAKATVFDFDSTSTTETSQITGLRYEKRGGASYTFPYGASATETAERNVRQDIITAVNAIGTASVSFTSEKI